MYNLFTDYRILLYVLFGILPSFIWLLYYLAKDKHPEPKKAILRVFMWGALMTIPAFFLQEGGDYILRSFNFDQPTYYFLYYMLIISLSEEICKFLVVKFKVMNSYSVDEPLDLMLYMVVSALGFAALENVLYLFHPQTALLSLERLLQLTVTLSLVRFVGATFLHTLSSAVVGYFLALEASNPQKKFYFTEMGLLIAVLLHGVYDLFIMKLQDYQNLLILSVTLLMFGFLTFIGFEKLKKMKSVTAVEIIKE